MSYNEKAYKFSVRDDTSFVVKNEAPDVPMVVGERSGIYEETSIVTLPFGDAEAIMPVQYDRLKDAVDKEISCALVVNSNGGANLEFCKFIRIDNEGILYFGDDSGDEPELKYAVHPNKSVEAVANEEEIIDGDDPIS